MVFLHKSTKIHKIYSLGSLAHLIYIRCMYRMSFYIKEFLTGCWVLMLTFSIRVDRWNKNLGTRRKCSPITSRNIQKKRVVLSTFYCVHSTCIVFVLHTIFEYSLLHYLKVLYIPSIISLFAMERVMAI